MRTRGTSTSYPFGADPMRGRARPTDEIVSEFDLPVVNKFQRERDGVESGRDTTTATQGQVHS